MHFTLVSTVSVFAVFLLVLSGSLAQTVKPYEFGFTIEEQQHRHEKRDERGIVMGEFGFITADGIYHVTVYATDEEGKFRILAMRNYPYESSPKTIDMVVVPKKTPTTTTTTPKPLPKHNFYQEACSGCFLKNGNNKGAANQDETKKTEIRPLSKPISTLIPPNKPLTKLNTNANTNAGKININKSVSNEKQFQGKDITETVLPKVLSDINVATTTANKVPIKETITNNIKLAKTLETRNNVPNTILPNRIKTQQTIAQSINKIQYKSSDESKTPATQQIPRDSTPTLHTPNTYVVYKPNSNVKPNIQITPKQIITNQVDYTQTPTAIKNPLQTGTDSEQTIPADYTTNIHKTHITQSPEPNKNIDGKRPFTAGANKLSAEPQTTNTAIKSSSRISTNLEDQRSSNIFTTTKSSAENLLGRSKTIQSVKRKPTLSENKDSQTQITPQLEKDLNCVSKELSIDRTNIKPNDTKNTKTTQDNLLTNKNTQNKADTFHVVGSSTTIGAEKTTQLPQLHLTQNNRAVTKPGGRLSTSNLKTQTLPTTPTTFTQELKQGTHLLTTTTETINNKNRNIPSHMKNIAATVVDTVTTIATPIKYEATKNSINKKPIRVTPTYTTLATQDNTVAHSKGKTSTSRNLLNSAIAKTQTGSQVGTKTFSPLNGPSVLNAARTPTGSAPPNANITPLNTASKQSNAANKAITFPQNSDESTSSGRTQTQGGVKPKFDLRVGSGDNGGSNSGSTGDAGDLYRFKYILDYNGHTETGSRNGNKVGNYFAIGDDDIVRTIEYVANEFGYQPRIRWRKLDTKVQSKENTLKDYEFVWFKKD